MMHTVHEHSTTPTFEHLSLSTGQIAGAIGSSFVLLPLTIVTGTRQVPKLFAACAVATSISMAYQCLVLGLWEYWAHVSIGTVMLYVAKEVCGNGLPITVPPRLACVFVSSTFVAIYAEYKAMKPGTEVKVMAMAHFGIYMLVMCLSIGMGLAHRSMTHLTQGFPNHNALNIITAFSLIAVGIIFSYHLHGTQPISIVYHKILAGLFIFLGIAHLWERSSMCAYMWILNGVWFNHMALMIYIGSRRRGLHHILVGVHHDPNEVAALYLAGCVWMSSVMYLIFEHHSRGSVHSLDGSGRYDQCDAKPCDRDEQCDKHDRYDPRVNGLERYDQSASKPNIVGSQHR